MIADPLDAIRADRKLRDLLGSSFDFHLLDGAAPPDWFRIDGVDAPHVIAMDGNGGEFLLFGDDNRLAYVSSEGRAGIIAASLEDAFALIVAYPYWPNLLDPDLSAMHDAAADAEESALDEVEDLDAHRAAVREQLGLKANGDPLAAMYRAITTLNTDFVVRPADDPDYVFDPLI